MSRSEYNKDICVIVTKENITYFEKPNSEAKSLTGRCDARVCKLNQNICQFRLDFTEFVLAGPSTSTTTTHFLSYGNIVGAAAPNRRAQTQIGKHTQLIIYSRVFKSFNAHN